MITHLAIGSGVVSDVPAGAKSTIVVELDRAMPGTDYDVSLLRPSRIPAEAVKVVKKEPQRVTIEVTLMAGNAGRLTIHAICVRVVGQPETPHKGQ